MDDNAKKEEFSYGYIQMLAAISGFSVEKSSRPLDNGGIDMTIVAPEDIGLLFSLKIDVQIKCTSSDTIIHNDYIHYPLPVKNYNRLRQKSAIPQILIVVVVSKNIEEWATIKEFQTILNARAYWISLKEYKETSNEKTITIKIPKNNLFVPKTIVEIMKEFADYINKTSI
ncbi:MAG: DUF4365 domain-containing protein [Cyanobacteria bacterium SBLK]|nr:DUF4365 domain-containing protein [Cyanobacteria bacterium SBLK]